MTASVTSLASAQCVSNHSWSCATSRALWTWTFSSMFFVRSGRVKLLEPTSAWAPTTSSLAWVM